ncbi:MAG TPA: tetratricopeptide repeat protein, partial [Pyrinomonadaceae bacterium]
RHVRKVFERTPPPISAEARRELEAKLAEAREAHRPKPRDADALVWLGRRTAYLGRFRESIGIYTEGLRHHPRDARFLRHRGHRYITVREFRLAERDLARAARLVAGRPDEVEPDGLPNARNQPTSTLKSNIWYHLGLARYLQGDFRGALAAYRECMKVSRNPDMLVATSHWLYMTLRRLNRAREATELLAPITPEMDIVENRDYHRLLLMYKGELTADAVLGEGPQGETSALSNGTVGYGVGNWHLYNGRRAEAFETFRRVVAGPQWTGFGHVAAEVELERLARSGAARTGARRFRRART